MSPKTLTGEELQLDDGPAHDSDLFLVDGNNLAYRAFFALPEELQTTDGQPTNALLGFTNMLFKLLSDYKPRGVAVAWDTRPVHRKEIDAEYKSERRAMPDLLREQFPHFRPIVEAFGYRNLRVRGLGGGRRHRDAGDARRRRWCEDVRRLHGPRRVPACVRERLLDDDPARPVRADVHVYTPERVEAPGIQPAQIPDFIGLKGDSSDNIPGIPGIGDKTAGQLVSQYGSLEGVVEHAAGPLRRPVEGDRRKRGAGCGVEAARDHASRPRPRRRPGEPGPEAAGSLGAQGDLRRFEFRGLLGRVDTLDEALPAAERPEAETETVPWREGDLAGLRGRVGVAADAEERMAAATEAGEVVVAPRPSDNLSQGEGSSEAAVGRPSYKLLQASGLEVVAHDAKPLRLGEPATKDTMLLAYLVDPGRAEYDLDDLMAEYAVELEPDPPAEEQTAALVRHAEAARRLAGPLLAKVKERGSERLYREVELPLTVVLGAMEDAGVRIDTYRMGEITARLADRIEELEARAYELAGEEFVIGSPQQLGRILFEKLELTPGRKGKTGYSTDSKVLRAIRADHEIVPAIEEWRELSEAREHVPRAATHAHRRGRAAPHDDNQTVTATGRLSRRAEPAEHPDPYRARPRDPHRLHPEGPGIACSRRTTRRSSCASSRTSRGTSRSCARRSRERRTSIRPPRPRCSARIPRRSRGTSGMSRR